MWTLNSVYHSVLIYWFVVTSMSQDVAWGNGKAGDYLVAGNIAYTVSTPFISPLESQKGAIDVQSLSH